MFDHNQKQYDTQVEKWLQTMGLLIIFLAVSHKVISLILLSKADPKLLKCKNGCP